MLAHIAGILQRARERRDLPQNVSQLNSPSLQQVVIDPETFLRFDDGVIRAALLRCAHDSELDYSAHAELSEQMYVILSSILSRPNSIAGEASLEFAFALRTRRLRLTKEYQARLIDEVCLTIGDKEFPCKKALISLLKSDAQDVELQIL